MVEVPTTETGVEVIIPVKNRIDMQQFIDIAKDVAAFGEMNVLINGTQVEIVPISTGENNMFPVSYTHLDVYKRQAVRRSPSMVSASSAVPSVVLVLVAIRRPVLRLTLLPVPR